jgi:serine/threonine protein kinase
LEEFIISTPIHLPLYTVISNRSVPSDHRTVISLLKPALKGNILIDDQLNARLCDFGIARILAEEGTSGFTTTSEHTGTERYLSYELVLSEVCAPTTASDIYALACMGLEVSLDDFLFYYQAKFALSLSTCNIPMPAETITFGDRFFRIFAKKYHRLVDTVSFRRHLSLCGTSSNPAGE